MLASIVFFFFSAVGDPVRVTVQPNKPLAVVGKAALGIGVAVWDDHMMDPAIPKLIRDAGFQVIRYPGGSYADLYHWKTHSSMKGFDATIRPGTDFDQFLDLSRKCKTTPLITVDYGSNPEATGGADPAEAADWVRYANKTKHAGVRYWEIGNEVYGNGFYNGQGWEIDLHAPDTHKKEDRLQNPLLGPTAYGRNVVAFVDAMKAVDPSIKVGAVLTGPGDWPYGVEPDWNSNVLRECGLKIDFVVVHWYGWGKSPSEEMDSLNAVTGKVARLREELDRYCGAHGKDVEIWMTEGDASSYNTRPLGALFAAHHVLTWLESGAAHVDWWDLHNGATKAFDGHLDDQGILSNGSSIPGQQEPAVNTPFPPYFGIKLVHEMARAGDTLVAVSSDSKSVNAHAARRLDGRISVLLINLDQQNPATASVDSGGGMHRRADLAWHSDGAEIHRKTLTLSGPDAMVELPPMSVAVVVFDRPTNPLPSRSGEAGILLRR